MAFAWTNSLEIGEKHIDSQHKELVDVTNELLEACAKGTGQEKLLETVNFLAGYAVKHFDDEEKLQIAIKYPGYQEHKKLHDSFKETVTIALNQLETQGASLLLVTKITTLVGNWLISHIKNEDAKIGMHMRKAA
jgi:hemerythrin